MTHRDCGHTCVSPTLSEQRLQWLELASMITSREEIRCDFRHRFSKCIPFAVACFVQDCSNIRQAVLFDLDNTVEAPADEAHVI